MKEMRIASRPEELPDHVLADLLDNFVAWAEHDREKGQPQPPTTLDLKVIRDGARRIRSLAAVRT